jgi:CRP-like cAMP-binding protein
LAASSDFHDSPMIRKMESVFAVTDGERQALETLPMQLAVIKADQDIVRIGDRPSRCCLILSGFACTYKVTAEGKRQIVSFNLPGDIPDLQSLHLKVLDTSIATISTCRVGFITHEALRDICDRYPRITAAFWREAYTRMAHVLCELLVRLRAVGLVEDHVCDLPITQGEFADALGVTNVHVNRVLQQMRADGLIETRGTQLRVPDWDKLKQVGEFDPTYLHLENDQAAA